MTFAFSCDGSTIGEAPKIWDGRVLTHSPWNELTTEDIVLCCMKQDTRTVPATYLEKITGARKRFNSDQVWSDRRTKLDALYTRPASAMPPTTVATLLSGAIVAQHFRAKALKNRGDLLNDGCVVVLVLGEALGRGHSRVAVGYGFNQADELTVSVIHGVVDEQSIKIGVAGESSPFLPELIRKFPTAEKIASRGTSSPELANAKIRRLDEITDERIIIVEHEDIERAAVALKEFAYRTDVRVTASAERGRRKTAVALMACAAATAGYAAWEFHGIQLQMEERKKAESAMAKFRDDTRIHLEARPFEIAWRGGYQPARIFETAEALWKPGTLVSIKAAEGSPPQYQLIAPRERPVQQGVMATSAAKQGNSPDQIRGFVRSGVPDASIKGADVAVSQEGRSFQKEYFDVRNEIEPDLRVDIVGSGGARSR